MKENLLKIYSKKQLRDIFKTYGDRHNNYAFVKVIRNFVSDDKLYIKGDILYMLDYPHCKTQAILLTRVMEQHNDFLNFRSIKDEELNTHLLNRCWWLIEKDYKNFIVMKECSFLFEKEGVENEEA